MPRITTLRSARLLMWCLLVCAVGCSGGNTKSTVRGTVTLDGAPLTEGNVNFQSEAMGAGASSPVSPDGTYELTGEVPEGDYVVTVSGVEAGPREAARTSSNIPKKYWSPATSQLEFTIIAGDNNYDIALTSGGK